MTTPVGTKNRLVQTGNPAGYPVLPPQLSQNPAPYAFQPGLLAAPAALAVLAAMYRARQVAMAQRISSIIGAMWAQSIVPAQFVDSWGAIRDMVLGMVRSYYTASAVDSVQLYEQMRVLSDLGPFRVAIPDLPQQELAKVVDSQSIGEFFHQIKTVDKPTASDIAGRSLQGSASRLALKGGRQTIAQAVHSDPKAQGWERVISGNACGFCAMLASRGAVYKSHKTADFRAHDHCNCTAVPLFEGQAPSDTSQALASDWRRETAGKSGKDAVHAWNNYWDNRMETRDGGHHDTTAPEPPPVGPGNAAQLE